MFKAEDRGDILYTLPLTDSLTAHPDSLIELARVVSELVLRPPRHMVLGRDVIRHLGTWATSSC